MEGEEGQGPCTAPGAGGTARVLATSTLPSNSLDGAYLHKDSVGQQRRRRTAGLSVAPLTFPSWRRHPQRSFPVGLCRVVYPRVIEATKLTCELPFERHWCSDGNPITLNTAGRVDAARSGTDLRLYAASMVIPSRCCANRSLADSLAVFISVAAWLAMPHCALINTPINTLCS